MQSSEQISFKEAFYVWLRVAALSFGGPAGQIAVMHRILVEEKGWISEKQFLHALNYCMLLPGPEAQQLATYIGWLLHKVRGGLVAGTLFILPGFVSILALSILYAQYQQLTIVQALFFGLKAAVLAIVAQALIKIARRGLRSRLLILIAILSFLGLFFFKVPFPVVIFSAGLAGFLAGRFTTTTSVEVSTESGDKPVAPPIGRSLLILGVFLSLWFLPLLVLFLVFGAANIFVVEGLFFSKAAVVTFGGAYAVLAYIGQVAVETYGWLQPGEMLDGLGMAETTPGPLIQVVQFVGFMGAYREAGELHPLLAGVLGSVVTTWVTFVPCFLWIFLGAPYIEYFRNVKALNNILSGITAAVVGVIANLAIWFFLHTIFADVREVTFGVIRLFHPEWNSISFASLLISLGAFVALIRFNAGLFTTLAISTLLGSGYYMLM